MLCWQGCEACRLFVMLLMLHTMMSVTGRPYGQQKRPEEVASHTIIDIMSGRTRVTRTAPGADDANLQTVACQQVSQKQLWLRLDSAQSNMDRSIGQQLTPSPLPDPIIENKGLAHRRPSPSHSKRSLQHHKEHSTDNTDIVDLAGTIGLRHSHRGRRRANINKQEKRARRTRRKFVKRIKKAKNISKIEKILFENDKQWQCSFNSTWENLGDGVFPEYIRTGSCSQKDCMFGFYTCKEKLYALPVLRRLSNQCSPIPTLGVYTQYEQAWVEDSVSVVVGCECSPIFSWNTFQVTELI